MGWLEETRVYACFGLLIPIGRRRSLSPNRYIVVARHLPDRVIACQASEGGYKWPDQVDIHEHWRPRLRWCSPSFSLESAAVNSSASARLWRLTPTTSAASSRARKGRKPAYGSLRKPRTCPRNSSDRSSPTTRGAILVPDLPKGMYNVWVRGYGLVDSAKVQSEPGKIVNLTSVPAPSAQAAAEYYPAQYWFSLLQLPRENEFPGTGPSGNGISTEIQNQAEWIAEAVGTDACMSCHGLGGKATRTIPESLGVFPHVGRGVGAPGAVGTSWRRHDWPADRGWKGPRAGDVRRLDRSHQGAANSRRRRHHGRRASSATW